MKFCLDTCNKYVQDCICQQFHAVVYAYYGLSTIICIAAVAVADMYAFLAGQCDRGSSRWKRICRASDKLCIIGTWHERMHCQKLGIIGPITECFQINSGFGSPETLLRPLKSLILAFICQIVIGFSLGFCFPFADLFCHYMFFVLQFYN